MRTFLLAQTGDSATGAGSDAAGAAGGGAAPGAAETMAITQNFSMDVLVTQLFEAILANGLRLFGAALLMIAAFMAARWVRRIVYKALDRPRIDQTLARFLATSSKWVILILAVVMALSIFGFNITGMAAILGAAGIAIGLALQGSLSNLAAGVMLLLLRPFKVGDVIQVGQTIGKVDEIELFHTKVDTGDMRRVILPNNQVFNGVIENYTHNGRRRVEVPVGVAYATDLERAREVLLGAAMSVEGRLHEPKPEVLLTGLGNSSVEFVVRVWAPASEFFAVRDRTILAAKNSLDASGITIPFPQMDLWVREIIGKKD